MIRANLLPRPKESISLFGIRLDSEYAREAFAGLGLAVLVAAIGFSIDSVRIARIRAELNQNERSISDRSIERAASKALVLDTARYERIERDVMLYRTSGRVVAEQIARIGDSVPGHVWLDSLQHDDRGFSLHGGSRRVSDVGDALSALSSIPSIVHAGIVSIDASGAGNAPDTTTFSANLELRTSEQR